MNLTNGRGTGKCHVCGKSTKLFVHQDCGKQVQKEKKRDYSKQIRRNYAKGKLPDFCFK